MQRQQQPPRDRRTDGEIDRCGAPEHERIHQRQQADEAERAYHGERPTMASAACWLTATSGSGQTPSATIKHARANTMTRDGIKLGGSACGAIQNTCWYAR